MSVTGVPPIKLSSGHSIPLFGLGTWKAELNLVEAAVATAIDVGYQHIDCSPLYGNEKEVGTAIQRKLNEGVVKRENLFITSKVWNTYHSKDKVRECLYKTLKDLKLDYLDLYLIHWPMGFKEGGELIPTDENEQVLFSNIDYIETWKAMEELCKEGLIRTIGLSNFNSEQIQHVIDNAEIPPAILQIESNPHLKQQKLLDFCTNRNIVLTAYACLGSPARYWESKNTIAVLDNPVIQQIAKRYDKTPAQICLRYQVQRGVTVIPKSSNKERLQSNIQVFDFVLSDADIKAIDDIPDQHREFHMGWQKGTDKHPLYPFRIEF